MPGKFTRQYLWRFYTSYHGRATRMDFNVGYGLVMIGLTLVATLLDVLIFGFDAIMSGESAGLFNTIVSLAIIWPAIVITTRRLHDLNLSGWWQAAVMLIIIPLGVLASMGMMAGGITTLSIVTLAALITVSMIFLLMLSIKKGTLGPNKYGPDPLPPLSIQPTPELDVYNDK